MKNDTLLSKALQALPIQDLISDLCPDSGARVGTERCVATWRGGARQSVEFYKAPDGITMYKDWAEDISGNAFNWLVNSFGLPEDAAAKLLISKAGIQLEPDNQTTSSKRIKSSNGTAKAKFVKAYSYKDLEGNIVCETVRFEPKSFSQRRPHPTNKGQWIWGLTAGDYKQNKTKNWSKKYKGDIVETFEQCQTILYNLTGVDIAKRLGETIYITEGEKDADNLIKLGATATCNIGGGGNWTQLELETLTGCVVVLLADNDEPDKNGKYKGEEVARKLYSQLEPKVKSISNPVFMPEGHKDVSDWIAAGGTLLELELLAKNAPILQEPKEDEPTAPKVKESKKERVPGQDNLKPTSVKDNSELEPDKKKDKPKLAPEPKEPKKTPAEVLMSILDQEDIELFNDGDNGSFARVVINGNAQSFSIKDSGFKRWLTRIYWERIGKALNENSTKEALSILDAKAQFEGDTKETFNRTARHGQNIYIDLANDLHEIIEITPTGWKVIDSSSAPVTFVKSRGTGALPTPVKGGKLEDLRTFVTVDDDMWALIASFLVGALKPEGPYPILNLIAEQGSGKSTMARIFKWIVDPSPKVGQLLRTAPRDDQALFIGANNNHILAFDNLSTIRPWLSDALCILSTGGSFVSRALYTDGEESSMEAMRPVILTGIGDLATRGDLLSRSLLISLPQLKHISTEAALWQGLEAARPSILGAIFTAMSIGLKEQLAGSSHEPETRLADFELWAVACEKGLDVQENGFLKAYRASKANAADVVLGSSPLAGLLLKLIKECRGQWSGTALELLDSLIDVDRKKQQDSTGVVVSYQTRVTNQKSFPRTPSTLSKNLDRIAPALRDVGIEIDRFKTNNRDRKRIIKFTDTNLIKPSTLDA